MREKMGRGLKHRQYTLYLLTSRNWSELIIEFRSRLISNIVTGKLDVRQAAVKLPQQPYEIELVEEIEEAGDNEFITETNDFDSDFLEAGM